MTHDWGGGGGGGGGGGEGGKHSHMITVYTAEVDARHPVCVAVEVMYD